MAASLCAANRRHFYRSFSWLLFSWLIVHICIHGRPKQEEGSSIPQEGNDTDKGDYLYDYGYGIVTYQQYNILLLFFSLYLDFCLNKCEAFLRISCIGFTYPVSAHSRYFPRMNCYWMELLLAVEVITPMFIGVQYLNAFTMYYHRLPFEEELNIKATAPTALGALWILAVYATLDGIMQLVWKMVCCLLYRKLWFSYFFGPAVEGDLEMFLTRMQGFSDWVFLNYIAQDL